VSSCSTRSIRLVGPFAMAGSDTDPRCTSQSRMGLRTRSRTPRYGPVLHSRYQTLLVYRSSLPLPICRRTNLDVQAVLQVPALLPRHVVLDSGNIAYDLVHHGKDRRLARKRLLRDRPGRGGGFSRDGRKGESNRCVPHLMRSLQIDEFTHPKTKRSSKTFRLNYRSMDR